MELVQMSSYAGVPEMKDYISGMIMDKVWSPQSKLKIIITSDTLPHDPNDPESDEHKRLFKDLEDMAKDKKTKTKTKKDKTKDVKF